MISPRTLRLLSHLCRTIIALTFIVSGFTKVIDPWGTAIKINDYLSTYGLDSLVGRASMLFSIWLCGAELMMGLMLMFKVRIRLVSIFCFVSMTFFTIITLLSATVLPVEDCGCFGEVIKLTAWQTFFKNITLLPMAAVVWWRYRADKIFAFNFKEVLLTVSFFTTSMGIGLYCVLHLPILDYLPYKIGVNLLEQINNEKLSQSNDGGQPTLIYRNLESGELQEFEIEDPEWQDDTKWEWVETVTETQDVTVVPLLSDFVLHDGEGEDVTQEVLSKEGFLYMICVNNFDHISQRCMERIEALIAHAENEHSNVVCLTPQHVDGDFHESFGGSEVDCYNIDASTLRTVLRANTGVVVLKDGVIYDKRNCRDISKMLEEHILDKELSRLK